MTCVSGGGGSGVTLNGGEPRTTTQLPTAQPLHVIREHWIIISQKFATCEFLSLSARLGLIVTSFYCHLNEVNHVQVNRVTSYSCTS